MTLPQWKGFFKEEIFRGIEVARRELNTYDVEVLIVECADDEPNICVEKISELKIPVITFNSDIATDNRVCFVGQDLIMNGRIAAEIMVKCISTDGKILVVVGNLKFSAHRQRLQFFFDRMTEHGRAEENFIAA